MRPADNIGMTAGQKKGWTPTFHMEKTNVMIKDLSKIAQVSQPEIGTEP